jgi:hypothetical protein
VLLSKKLSIGMWYNSCHRSTAAMNEVDVTKVGCILLIGVENSGPRFRANEWVEKEW